MIELAFEARSKFMNNFDQFRDLKGNALEDNAEEAYYTGLAKYDEDTDLDKMHSPLMTDLQVAQELKENSHWYKKYHSTAIKRYMAYRRVRTSKTQTYENIASALTMFDAALAYKKLKLTTKNLQELVDFCAHHRLDELKFGQYSVTKEKRAKTYFTAVLGQIQTFLRISFGVIL